MRNAQVPTNTARRFLAAFQSNMVYLPQEMLLVSASLASRQINAIRYALDITFGGTIEEPSAPMI